MISGKHNDEPQMQIASGTSGPQSSSKSNRISRFKYYIHDSVAQCRMELLGELAEGDLGELNGCWRTVRTILDGRPLVLDLQGLKSVDEAGKQWLAGMAQEGAICLPECYLRDLVAGKHVTGFDAAPAPKKLGLFGRLVSIFRSPDVEGAK